MKVVLSGRTRLVAAAALLALNCSSTTTAVRDQASSDLSCPAEQITVHPLGGPGYVAEGCGRVQHYAAGPGAESYRPEGCPLKRFRH